MIRSYLPAIVFLILGGSIGAIFAALNNLFGPRRPSKAKSDPYECGLPSEVQKSFKFGVSFYLVAMLFILFDIEVIFLYPVAIQLKEFGTFALPGPCYWRFVATLPALGGKWTAFARGPLPRPG